LKDCQKATIASHYGRRIPIPPTVQILDDLRTGYVLGYVPRTKRAAMPRSVSPQELAVTKEEG